MCRKQCYGSDLFCEPRFGSASKSKARSGSASKSSGVVYIKKMEPYRAVDARFGGVEVENGAC